MTAFPHCSRPWSRGLTDRIDSTRSDRRRSGFSYLAESRGPGPRRHPDRSGDPRVGFLINPGETTRPRTPPVPKSRRGNGGGVRNGHPTKGRPPTRVSRGRKSAERGTTGSIPGCVSGPATVSLGTRFGLPVGAARKRRTIQYFRRIRGGKR